MSNMPRLTLSELDGIIELVGLPVRAATLEQAWDFVSAPGRGAQSEGHVVLLVTLRARTGRGPQLEEAALEFVAATRRLAGAMGSTIHRSSSQPLTWFLIERFSGQDALASHIASEYFRHFQQVQQPLLAEPVDVMFLAGRRPGN